MINTVQIKQQQLSKGFFTIGSGAEVILVLGSCRVVNYISYLQEINTDNRFTIHSLDPFNWNWDAKDRRVDYIKAIEVLETNPDMLKMLASVTIFIHEYYANFGMFNCDRENEKNIYQFGMKADIDICIPNFNDLFILFGDIVTFDERLRKMAIQDYLATDKLSEFTENEIFKTGKKNIEKFYDVCSKSDLPEMAEVFKEWACVTRLFWTYNHVTKYFTLAVFQIMNEKFLHLSFVYDNRHEDIFANNYTHLTEYDRKYYGFQWDEEIRPLRSKLF